MRKHTKVKMTFLVVIFASRWSRWRACCCCVVVVVDDWLNRGAKVVVCVTRLPVVTHNCAQCPDIGGVDSGQLH